MKTFLKILLAIIILALLIVAIFILIRYINYKKDKREDKPFIIPKVELTIMEITSLTKEKTKAHSKILIHNPLPVGLTIDSIAYKVYINNEEVIRSTYPKAIIVKRNDSSMIDLPVTILNEKLITTLKNSEKQGLDSVEYKIHSTFYSNLVLKKSFDVEIKKLLPLIYIPEIKVTRARRKDISLSELTLLLDLSISNKNVFPIRANNVFYRFSIEGHPWVKGEKTGLVNIPAKSNSTITLPLKVSLKEIGKTVLDMFKEGDDLNYNMEVTFQLEENNKMLKNSRVMLEGSGTVQQLIKEGKKK